MFWVTKSPCDWDSSTAGWFTCIDSASGIELILRGTVKSSSNPLNCGLAVRRDLPLLGGSGGAISVDVGGGAASSVADVEIGRGSGSERRRVRELLTGASTRQ